MAPETAPTTERGTGRKTQFDVQQINHDPNGLDVDTYLWTDHNLSPNGCIEGGVDRYCKSLDTAVASSSYLNHAVKTMQSLSVPRSCRPFDTLENQSLLSTCGPAPAVWIAKFGPRPF